MRTVVIDTDACVDDLFAIALALRSPEMNVSAILLNGRGSQRRLSGLYGLLSILGSYVPVYVGSEETLDPDFDHGHPASQFLHQEVSSEIHARPITEFLSSDSLPAQFFDLVALGPLSNVKFLLDSTSKVQSRLRCIHIVGGQGQGRSFSATGNNLRADFTATESVLGADVPLLFFPEKVTSKLTLSWDTCRPNGDEVKILAEWLLRMARSWGTFHRRNRIKLHDVVPICCLLNYNLDTITSPPWRGLGDGAERRAVVALPRGFAEVIRSRLGISIS
jgi:inosine-uridine nucleoside N-ribohydrolase